MSFHNIALLPRKGATAKDVFHSIDRSFELIIAVKEKQFLSIRAICANASDSTDEHC